MPFSPAPKLSTPIPEPSLPRRYLQEYAALGTAGGIYHFRDQILAGGADAFFVLNADVCSEFPLQEMLDFRLQHGDKDSFVILGTTVRGKGQGAMQLWHGLGWKLLDEAQAVSSALTHLLLPWH